MALLSVINAAPRRLFNTKELGAALGYQADQMREIEMLDRALQLLIHTGDIVQHPHHVLEEGSNVTLCVWSSKRGPWIKPPLLNPLLQVLHAAAQPDGAFLKDLSARSAHPPRFSNHSIKSAANTLRELNLVHFELMSEGNSRGTQFQHVRLTDDAIEIVKAWDSISFGAELSAEVYNPLRRALVTRTPIVSSQQMSQVATALTGVST